jgi:hypothetical protein
MSAYLKTFELILNCLGPVFIGSGEQRTPKEYVQGKRHPKTKTGIFLVVSDCNSM